MSYWAGYSNQAAVPTALRKIHLIRFLWCSLIFPFWIISLDIVFTSGKEWGQDLRAGRGEEDDGEARNVKMMSSRQSPAAILVDAFQKQKKRSSPKKLLHFQLTLKSSLTWLSWRDTSLIEKPDLKSFKNKVSYVSLTSGPENPHKQPSSIQGLQAPSSPSLNNVTNACHMCFVITPILPAGSGHRRLWLQHRVLSW